MQWSNLNEQMIEQFFQNSNSPTNADISLNFTRTSRQNCSNNKENKEISPRIQHQEIHSKTVNPETDLFQFADQQLKKFDIWFKNINQSKQTSLNQITLQIKQITQSHIKQQQFDKSLQRRSFQKAKQLKQNIMNKVQGLQQYLKSEGSYSKCQNCQVLGKKYSSLQCRLKQVQNELKNKNTELNRINQLQIRQLGQQMEFKVQNKLLKDEFNKLAQKNQGLNDIIDYKNKQIGRLIEEIQKFNLQKSTYHFKNKTLQNRLHQMQKSKSMLLSAAKNSTSHSQFNITTQNGSTANLKSSQTNQQNDTFIQTNQFTCQKSMVEPDDYIGWFDRIKTVFLEKYKKQEKQHLMKFQVQNPAQKSQNVLKEVIANFKKGHVRYEVARSCKTIADYIKKNKDNFFELLGQQFGSSQKSFIKDKIMFTMEKQNERYSSSAIQECEQELKKAQKISAGLESQIKNLNNQLITLRRQLIKQKEQKTHLCRQLSALKEQINQIHEIQIKNLTNDQNQQKFIKIQQQVEFKNQEIKKLVSQGKRIQEQKQKIELSIKELEYLLYKERKQKIKWFRNSLNDFKTMTACRIRSKNISQKQYPSAVHEFQGRIYVEKEKASYKYDIIEHSSKKASNQIFTNARKLIQNCFYGPGNSLILSVGSKDSQFRQFIRSDKGLIASCIEQMFKFKQAQKRFIQTGISLQVIEITNAQIFDLLDFENVSRKISLKKDGQKVYLSNCNIFSLQNEQEGISTCLQAIKNQKKQGSHIFITFEFSMTDKRNKQKFQSKIIFGQMEIEDLNQTKQNGSNLVKDSKSIWNALNCINFSQSCSLESNRLTYLLSECLTEKNKNMLIVNVSPTQFHKQISLKSLNFGSSLKCIVQKPLQTNDMPKACQQYLLKNRQKTPQASISKLKHNLSQNQISTPMIQQVSECKSRLIRHRNSSSDHTPENNQKKKRTISRLSIF